MGFRDQGKFVSGFRHFHSPRPFCFLSIIAQKAGHIKLFPTYEFLGKNKSSSRIFWKKRNVGPDP